MQANAQMQPAPQAPQGIPDAFLQPAGGGIGGLFRGLASGAHNGLLGMIGGGIAGAAGQGEGDRYNAQLNAQYQALIAAGVPQQKALLAVISPDYAKTILPAELGADKYAFTTLPDGTVVRQNAKTGEVAPAYVGNLKPTWGVVSKDENGEVYGWIDPTRRNDASKGITPYQPDATDESKGTVTGPDGKPIAIPPGVNRKTFVNEVSRANAKAAAGEKTEVQAKAEIFANKMESSEAILSKLQDQGQSYLGRISEGSDYIPGSATVGRTFQSDNYQKYQQARSNFITALLRQESGAAINKSEFERYDREYMPQPGDGKEVLKQKQEARRVAIEAMRKGAGPGYKSPTAAPSAADPLGIR
jgi:hypothetical protein